MAAAAVAAATFRSPHQPATNGVPVPLPSVRFQSLQRHRVGGLCLGLRILTSPRGRPVLLPPFAAAAGEAFSSDEEEFEGEDEEEYFDEGESEPEEEQVEAPRACSSPRSRPPRGDDPGRLFVGNLPYTFTSEELNEAFSEAGRVDDAQIIYMTRSLTGAAASPSSPWPLPRRLPRPSRCLMELCWEGGRRG
ncbi:unnamed protein product [Urochloa humidicola]